MASIIVENRVCEACGADVRPGSLFCYNCGESVEPKPETVASDEKENVSPVWFNENFAENGNKIIELKPLEIKTEIDSGIAENPELIETTNESAKEIEGKAVEKIGIEEQAKLKSAASLRRKPKTVQRKKVEVVWEEHENAPNGWFIVVAIILTAVAAGIVFLAMRLR